MPCEMPGAGNKPWPKKEEVEGFFGAQPGCCCKSSAIKAGLQAFRGLLRSPPHCRSPKLCLLPGFPRHPCAVFQWRFPVPYEEKSTSVRTAFGLTTSRQSHKRLRIGRNMVGAVTRIRNFLPQGFCAHFLGSVYNG